MTLAEIQKCFEQVISDIQSVLPRQTNLVDYVKLEGKLEAYADSLKLISSAIADEQTIAPEPTTKAKSTTKD